MAAAIKAVLYCCKEDQLVYVELCRVLLDRGHTVVLVSGTEGRKDLRLNQKLAVQPQQISHDLPLGGVAAALPDRKQPSVQAEASWLRVQKAQVVISAAIPWACAAAAAAGVCAVCVANSTGGNAVHSF